MESNLNGLRSPSLMQAVSLDIRCCALWLLIVQWVVGSIHHCALIELFLIPTSDQHLECCDYPICRIVHIKDPFLLIKRTQVEAVSSLVIQ